MPIKYGSKVVNDVFYGNKRVLQIYQGSKLVYNAEIRLPSGYTKLEYIQNDSDSYIKTGVIDGTDDLSYEADFTYLSGSGYGYVLGAYGGDSFKNTVLYIRYGETIGGWVNKAYSGSVMTSDIVSVNKRIKCYADSTKFVVNGITKTSFADGTQRDGAELYLFRRNGDGKNYAAQTTSNVIIKLHSLKIKNKNVAVRNFIPAMRNSDGEIGLYDTVTRKFFTNAGNGKFIAGPRFVEYIKFDGDSYIDIDYIPSSNTRVVGKVSFTQWHPIAGANYVFGVFGDNTNFGFNVGSDRGIMNVPWGTNSGIKFNNINTFGQVYSFDISKNGAYLDGVLKLAGYQLSETFTATKSFFVGWSNGTSVQKLIGNIYPMKIYENDVLVKDLHPCLDDNDVACLYDKVTGEYYYNKGTGKIGAALPKEYVELEYIESTGTQYIDLGINKIQEMECNLVAQLTDTNLSGFPTFIGAMKSEKAFKVVLGINSSLQLYSQLGDGSGFIINKSITGDLNKHIYEITTSGSSTSSLTIDGNTINGDYALTSDNDTDISLYLFARHKQDGNVYQFIKMRCYELTIKYANKIARKLVPAMRISDGTIGMYDLHKREFLTNAGTGTFTSNVS